MKWVYLSPHYDDAIFSCGGLIWQQANAGDDIVVLTICGGEPPAGELSPFASEIHRRWGTGREVVSARQLEDQAACAVAGALPQSLNIPDCIYRSDPRTGKPLIVKNENLFQPQPPVEVEVLAIIKEHLAQIPPDVQLVTPLGIGMHIDHHLVRAAAQDLQRPLWFYADFPYAAREKMLPETWLPPVFQTVEITLHDNALEKWVQAVACYKSQISTFWHSLPDIKNSITGFYHSDPYGHRVWSFS